MIVVNEKKTIWIKSEIEAPEKLKALVPLPMITIELLLLLLAINCNKKVQIRVVDYV